MHKRVFVAGETGLVGRALSAALQKEGADILCAPRATLDLTDQAATLSWFEKNTPDCVFVAAAKVGGIHANRSAPADFIRANLSIALNVIEGAHRAGVQHLLFLGSSCIYPRDCPQPIREEYLMTGPLEPTNAAYAVAKIAGIELCKRYSEQYGRRYICAMPTNLYGPHDRFDDAGGHVIPSMMVKFGNAIDVGAQRVSVWGTGTPLREFLYADDLACALITMMECAPPGALWNIGSGEEVSIAQLAHTIARVSGFKGEILFDSAMPDGTPRKFLDSRHIRAAGWVPQTGLEEGLAKTWAWYRAQQQTRAHAA